MKTELSILNKNTQKDEFGNRVWKEGEVITAMKENACERMRDIVDELHTLYINDNSKDFAVFNKIMEHIENKAKEFPAR